MVSVQLLPHFSCNFHETFRKWLSPSVSAHIVTLWIFGKFYQSYCPLSITVNGFRATPSTFLMRFSRNFHKMIVTNCFSAYRHAVDFRQILPELLPFVYYRKWFLCNSFHILNAIFTKLSQDDCHQVPQRILSCFWFMLISDGVIALCLFL